MGEEQKHLRIRFILVIFLAVIMVILTFCEASKIKIAQQVFQFDILLVPTLIGLSGLCILILLYFPQATLTQILDMKFDPLKKFQDLMTHKGFYYILIATIISLVLLPLIGHLIDRSYGLDESTSFSPFIKSDGSELLGVETILLDNYCYSPNNYSEMVTLDKLKCTARIEVKDWGQLPITRIKVLDLTTGTQQKAYHKGFPTNKNEHVEYSIQLNNNKIQTHLVEIYVYEGGKERLGYELIFMPDVMSKVEFRNKQKETLGIIGLLLSASFLIVFTFVSRIQDMVNK